MHKTSKIKESLTTLMERTGVSENKLWRETGVNQSTINRILSGETLEPKMSNVDKLAAYFGLEGHDLITGNIDGDVAPVTEQNFSNLEKQYSVPLLTWDQIRNFRQFVDDEAKDRKLQGVTMIKVSRVDGPRVFCCKVEGDSMSSSETRHSFPDGTVVQIDPDTPAENQSYVIAKPNKAAAPVFKQLVIDGDRRYLKPLNSRYPIIECGPDFEIIGVAVELRLDLRTP